MVKAHPDEMDEPYCACDAHLSHIGTLVSRVCCIGPAL